MPTSPLEQLGNDLGVSPKAPRNSADARVPLADEFSLGARITFSLFRGSRPGSQWLEKPNFSVSAPRSLSLANFWQLLGP
jgi:hypothetical protein